MPKFPGNVEHGDITKELPLSEGSANAIYASHVLEHLPLEDFRKAIQNTYKYLKKGGDLGR